MTLLGYAPGTVGRLMTPHYIAVREDWTVQQVLDYVREHGQDSETLNVIYVVDDAGVLIDDIRIREFLVVPLHTRVQDLMDRRYVALKATDTQESAVDVFRREDRTALPVTDTAGVLIGIVTVDDVLDVAEEAATREFQLFGGSEALDEPYLRSRCLPDGEEARGLARGPVSRRDADGHGDGLFREGDRARRGARALRPAHHLERRQLRLAGVHAGHSRAGALGELTPADWWRVIATRGVFGGLALGVHSSVRSDSCGSRSGPRSPDIYGPHWLLVALTVSLSLVGVVLWGTLVGSIAAVRAAAARLRSATSSAPFVATLVDVTGLVIYFSVGLVVLRGTLL